MTTAPAINDADLARVDATIGGPTGRGGGEWITFAEHPLSTLLRLNGQGAHGVSPVCRPLPFGATGGTEISAAARSS